MTRSYLDQNQLYNSYQQRHQLFAYEMIFFHKLYDLVLYLNT